MNIDDVAAFPICWPDGWPRAKSRKNSQFKVANCYDATSNLSHELAMMGVGGFTLSTSVPLRRDGLPLSKPPVDGDPGAAVYFTRKGKAQCLACDQYTDVQDNIHALAKTLEAMRGIERWGSTDLLDRAFTGFAALPTRKPPWEVLGIAPNASVSDAKKARNQLALTSHPDVGGDGRMSEINAAFDEFVMSKT